MKNIKKLLVSLMLLVLAVSMIPTASAAFDRSYTALYGSPMIDGEVDDIWNGAEWTDIDKPYDGTNDSNSVVRVKLLWDEGLLYFLADIIDYDFNETIDVLEIYLDQTNTKTDRYGSDDSQTRFMLGGEVITGPHAGTNAQTDAEFKVKKIEDNEYIMEGALYCNVAGTPQAGNIMGIEFMYQDGKAGQMDQSQAVEYYRWNVDTANGDKAAWESTRFWGILYLADEEGYVPDDVETLTAPPTTEPEITEEPPVTTRPPVVGKPKQTTAAPVTTDAPAPTDDATGLPTGAIIAIAVAGVAVVAAVVIIVVKKKKQ